MQKWNEALLQEAGLTSDLLPTVVDSGQEAGQLENSWYGIPAKTPVIASLGKCQSSSCGFYCKMRLGETFYLYYHI